LIILIYILEHIKYKLHDPSEGMESLIKKCYKSFTRGTHKRVYKVNEFVLINCEYNEDAVNEISMLKSLDHPNVIKILDIKKDSNGYNRVWIQQEFKGKSCFDLKGSINESDIMTVATQMLDTFRYLESRNVLHRDIKPENILAQMNGQEGLKVTLIDFNLATNVIGSNMSADVYNEDAERGIYFRPPEINSEKIAYGFSADIWALGASLLEMKFGESIYKYMYHISKCTKSKHVESILEIMIEESGIEFKDERLKTLVISMLHPLSKRRPTAAESLEFLGISLIDYPKIHSEQFTFKSDDILEWMVEVTVRIDLPLVQLYYALVIYYRATNLGMKGITRACLMLSACIIDGRPLDDIARYFDLGKEDAYRLIYTLVRGLNDRVHIIMPSHNDDYYLEFIDSLSKGEEAIGTMI
jgi:serine/threonine protein kinase